MKHLYAIIAVFLATSVDAQTTLPVINATSRNVAINDGGYLDANAWTLSPEAKPDIYTANRSRKPQWVAFYTDIDSIKVKVTPGSVFDFIILLNGKDSCYTRITSAISPENHHKKEAIRHDTIPFILTAHNAIQVKAILDNRDTLNLHFDIGSLDFRLTKDAILKKTTLLSNQPEALSGQSKPDFNHLEQVKKIQMGSLVWDKPNVRASNNAARDMDGRFGWRVFDGKVVEVDYDNRCMVVHSQLPKRKKGYVKSDIKFIQSLFCIPASIEIDHKKYSGNFLFDTGSDLAMVLDSSWMSHQHFPQNLPVIKKSSFSDGAGRKYETSIVSVPAVTINGFTLTQIPTSNLGSNSPVGFEMNYFGNDLLKRFNVIIDLKKDVIYLKANNLVDVPYLVKK